MTWPCQENPDRWFSSNRREIGKAVHQCLSHCPRLAECDATEDRPPGGVLAGVAYVAADDYGGARPDKRPVAEIPCDRCGAEPDPVPTAPKDTGACGTPRGFHRHVARNQQPCKPCTAAKQEYQRERYRTWARNRNIRMAS